MKYLKLLFLCLGVVTLLVFISLQFPSVKKEIYKTLFKATVNNSMSVWEDNNSPQSNSMWFWNSIENKKRSSVMHYG